MTARFFALSVVSVTAAFSLLAAAPSHAAYGAASAIYWEDAPLSAAPSEETFEAQPARYEAQPARSARFEAKPVRNETLIAARPARPVKAAAHAYRSGRQTAAEKAQRILELVNGERTRRGLSPLVWDEKLAQAALRHSQDMVRRNYFSHFSPEGESVTERVVGAGAEWMALGENLASDMSVPGAHASLMASPGHRDNLLKRSYGRVGIGVVSSEGQVMVTQVFAD